MNNNPISPKVAAAGVSAAVATIIIWIVQSIWKLDIPVEIGMAIATVVAAIGGYVKTDPLRKTTTPLTDVSK